MNISKLEQNINIFWDHHIIPILADYLKIPSKSPAFDSDWDAKGYLDDVIKMSAEWVKKHKPAGSTLHTFKEKGRTPLLILEIPGNKEGTVLMYGHLDKQPEMEGWSEGLSPWTPILKNDKLYGRGGADDGYALFSSLCAVNALLEQGIETPRIVILIECSEESGSPDLPFYMDHCSEIIGTPDLVICLDSGAGNYEQFWMTTSLRGLIACTLRVDILEDGIHSGTGSGIVPSSFRIIRQLLSRLEDEQSGQIIVEDLNVEIPDYRLKEVEAMVHELGDDVFQPLPFVENATPITDNKVEMVLNNTWRSMLSVVGADGIPSVKEGGNVLRPYTSVKLSLRIPPNLDALKAQEIVQNILLKNPPYGSKVSIEFEEPASGWNAPPFLPWLEEAIQQASNKIFCKPALAMGEGGTIPFMSMLGEKFPNTQFVITGVLGPKSNAHGPNEFLNIPFAKKLTACTALILESSPTRNPHKTKKLNL